MTVQQTLTEGKRLLSIPCPASQVDSPALDAALLLAEALHTSREELILKANESISEAAREKFFSLLERRRGGECVAYILGRKEFRGLEFAVSPKVLVPRPDTETLVEAALERINSLTATGDGACGPLRILDLCTGSGAAAIALKNERPFLEVSASDISAEALELAAENAAKFKLTVSLIQSDLFENISGKFDIIVSNPPYIPSGEISTLAPEVRREPRLALDGGTDGLELIRKIISQAPDFLRCGGALILEAAPEQMPAIRDMLREHSYGGVKVYRDLAGRERVISAKSDPAED
ncbi:MAG: peptide chain release factor N(5)-glutamine methyltransferase [Treponema sp.]|nr:peptide chain release factor N(5)-glutamine methyltransferase [Treponema sp.]